MRTLSVIALEHYNLVIHNVPYTQYPNTTTTWVSGILKKIIVLNGKMLQTLTAMKDYVQRITAPHSEISSFIKKLNSDFKHFAVNKYIILSLMPQFYGFYFFLHGPAPVYKQSTSFFIKYDSDLFL